jgi:hypothetical protein
MAFLHHKPRHLFGLELELPGLPPQPLIPSSGSNGRGGVEKARVLQTLA